MGEKDRRVMSINEGSRANRTVREDRDEKAPTAVGREAVLLVEDDPPLRQVVRWSLEGLGYGLLEARNGKEALRIATDYPGRLDLLLTDVVMPLMDGFELAERVAEEHPETKILFVTGHAGKSVAKSLIETRHELLLKPFSPDELACKIRELLDRTDTMHERHAAVATAVLDETALRLKTLDADQLKPSEVARLMEAAARVKRIALGEARETVGVVPARLADAIRADLLAEGLLQRDAPSADGQGGDGDHDAVIERWLSGDGVA